jgi:formylglycine-generating enzyme required for sulfatase activity
MVREQSGRSVILAGVSDAAERANGEADVTEDLFTQRGEEAGDKSGPVPFPAGDRYRAVQDEAGQPIQQQGGMGVVFHAIHARLDIPVAIKRIRADYLQQADAAGRFLSEARAQVRLSHPHIVRVQGFEEDEYGPWMVLDWIEGQSLQQRVQQQGVLSAADALRLLIPIAEALHYAHGEGFIHRDVKPGNILLRSADGIPLLTDFGLVRSAVVPLVSQQLSQGGATLGTLDFMSPEQLADPSSVDRRTDVYSLGATLHWLCTGRMMRSFRERQTPKDVLDLILNSTEDAPHDRYADMGEFADAMRAALVQAGCTATDADPSQPPSAETTAVRNTAPETPPRDREQRPPVAQGEDISATVRRKEQELRDVQDRARQLLAEYQFAEAVMLLDSIEENLRHKRDQDLYQKCLHKLQQCEQLEQRILPAAKQLRLKGLRPWVEALLKLQPGRSDMLNLLEQLPDDAGHLLSPFSADIAIAFQNSFASSLGREVEITNGIGMKFRLIPPGTFLMGSPDREQDRSSSEHQHEVTLTRAFYMGVYPVTQREWTSVMGSNPSHFQTRQSLLSRWFSSEQIENENVDFPVECVSWNAAQEFLGKLNASHGMSGVRYRLPTEAEWEYACRAGTTSPFSFGGVLQGDQANCDGRYPYGTSSKGPYLERPSAVGSYEANGFGLHDMHGNVWEWCQDWYDGDYYSSSPSEGPAGPSSGSSRVLRGGSWRNNPAAVVRRTATTTVLPASRYYFFYFGFRVLCELS